MSSLVAEVRIDGLHFALTQKTREQLQFSIGDKIEISLDALNRISAEEDVEQAICKKDSTYSLMSWRL